MVDEEAYVRYRADSTVLAAIGKHVDAQVGHVTVRLPRAVAEAAVAAWERDESGDLGEETSEQSTLRDQAGDLALIGLVISERGRWEGEEVVIDLNIVFAGAAVLASL
ncbi:hypothetical protein OG413_07410 [Streptomyces sp. NBC_01433]|uniref:hypothetical protein n=1 Tax=Streptomyces sp. NBC_01433 TaxID=2903864 RepID=UPI002259CEAF|nr:hypothetical protein [Streptomyces sp. NBC_01433]MCX4675152.1 hypothetical protein [Streptomyces sp. NBC_01433]